VRLAGSGVGLAAQNALGNVDSLAAVFSASAKGRFLLNS
jgi:hypothetical protein